MSMSFISFHCDRCDYASSSMVMWGRYSYLWNGQEVPLNRDLGWCSGCSAISVIEVFAAPQKIEEEKRRLTRLNIELAEERAALDQRRSWSSKLVGLEPKPSRRVRSFEGQIHNLERTIEANARRAEIWAARSSPPRCLRCGSKDIALLPPRPDIPEGQTGIGFGFFHPGCRGEIRASHSGIRIAAGLTHRLYDAEGRFLEERPESMW